MTRTTSSSASLRLTNRDRALLRTLAEFRVLTLSQVKLLHFPSLQTARRRVRRLIEHRLLRALYRREVSRTGRPERVVALTPEGLAAIGCRNGRSSTTGYVEHQLLVNSLWLHLLRLTRRVERLEGAFLPEHSALLPRGQNGGSWLSDEVVVDGTAARFCPDAVLFLRDIVRELGVLFFLEADRGTEPLVDRSGRATLATKLRCYHGYSVREGYRRYEKTWNQRFRGFRVLFVTETVRRAEKIRRFLAGQRNAEFAWVTSMEQVARKGVGARIWSAGGEKDGESILGSIADEISAGG